MDNKRGTYRWIYKNSKSCVLGIIVRTVISLLTSFGTVAAALISKDIIDIAIGEKTGSIIKSCIFIVAIVFGVMLLKMLDSVLTTVLNCKLMKVYQKGLLSSFTDKKYSCIKDYHSGEIINRMTNDVNTVIDGTVNLIPEATYTFSKIVVAFVAIWMLNYYIAAVAAVIAIFMFIGSRVYGRWYKSLHKKQQNAYGVVQSFLQECVENIIVIKSFSQKKSIGLRLDSYINKRNRIAIKKAIIGCFSIGFVFIFLTLGYYVILGWGALQVGAGGAFTYGTLTALLQLFQQIRTPISSFSGLMPKLFSMTASAERLIEIENLPNDCENIEPVEPFDFDSIEAKNLSFRYDEEDDIVLNGTDISIKKGSMMLISGESGVGKSTFFRLLLSFYEYEGELYFTSGDKKIPVTAAERSMFSYVPQGNLVLSGTIRDNICFGCSDTVTDEQIQNALRISDIDEFINSLPAGIDTTIGERGVGLSEGQLQRLAVARAILSDAPVLLLDECTSALDEQTEYRLLNNIRELKTKTVILISHKTAALDVCDGVIKLQDKQFTVSELNFR